MEEKRRTDACQEIARLEKSTTTQAQERNFREGAPPRGLARHDAIGDRESDCEA
jgi:hypothetical protein